MQSENYSCTCNLTGIEYKAVQYKQTVMYSCSYTVSFNNLFAVNFNICNIILENSWYIDFRKLIFAEDNQQTSFSACTITNNYQLLPDCSHCSIYLHKG